jgi:hypothetical protein
MSVKITINLFSGVKNPSFILSDAAYEKHLQQFSIDKFKKPTKVTKPYPAVLGFRGITIEQQGNRNKLEDIVVTHLTHDAAFANGLVADAKVDFSQLIFDNLEKIRGIDTPRIFRKKLEQSVEDFINKRELYNRNYAIHFDKTLLEFYRPLKYKACYCSPVPDLDNWNTLGVQGGNNCYNYGTNYRTDTFAQPGEATGNMYNDMNSCNPGGTAKSVKAGAISDGLIELPTNDNKCPSSGHLVALVLDTTPGQDYHWYRKGSSGKWSHKPGGGQATILDSSGLPITDPRTCDRGRYNDFCTFMQVIHGHFKIT